MTNNKKFIYLGLSSIFIVSIFLNFLLIFNNRRQSKKTENVVNLGKKNETVAKKDTLSTLLFTVDKERQDHEVCGYKYNDIVDNLVLSKNQQANARFENGVWANDCQIYAYAIKLMQPAVQASSAEEKLWGIWTYDPIKKENKQIYNSSEDSYPIVYRFVASDIISAAGKLINTKTGQVITTLSSTEWVKYRDSAFPWTFSYPREWRIATEETEYFPEDENLTIKKLVMYSGKFRIEFLNYIPEFDKSKYSDNYANFGGKYGYLYYFDSKLSLDPSSIYLYQKDDQKYPPAITFTQFNDPTGVYIKNLFGDILPTIKKYE